MTCISIDAYMCMGSCIRVVGGIDGHVVINMWCRIISTYKVMRSIYIYIYVKSYIFGVIRKDVI